MELGTIKDKKGGLAVREDYANAAVTFAMAPQRQIRAGQTID